MDDSTKHMIEGIKTAIQMEVDGNNFYTLAAKGTGDKMGKAAFQTLADEEQGHMDFLMAQYKSVCDTGCINPDLKLGPKADLSGSNPIFSADMAKRIKFAQVEMSALSIGIMLELSSIEFYKKHAAEETEPAVREFYNELAGWEKGHYDALFRQQNALREDYYARGGFAPF
jgi:rubrerythrin